MAKKPSITIAPPEAPHPKVPRVGGSFLVTKTGEIERRAGTIQSGDPDHEDSRPAAPAATSEGEA